MELASSRYEYISVSGHPYAGKEADRWFLVSPNYKWWITGFTVSLFFVSLS